MNDQLRLKTIPQSILAIRIDKSLAIKYKKWCKRNKTSMTKPIRDAILEATKETK